MIPQCGLSPPNVVKLGAPGTFVIPLFIKINFIVYDRSVNKLVIYVEKMTLDMIWP